MRTLKYTYKQNTSVGNWMQLETEILLDSDEDAEEEGRKAQVLFANFFTGMADGAEGL